MTLKVYVDWQANADFTDSIDDISDDIMAISWRLGMRNAFQPLADEMTLAITVKNDDGKYTPENTSSPLSGYILPNRTAKVEFVSGGTVTMWRGFLDFPEVLWDPSGTATAKIAVTLNGVGAKSLLENEIVNLPLYQDTTGDVIIQDVLEQTTFPSTVTSSWVLGVPGRSEIGVTTYLGDVTEYADLDTGTTTFEYYGDLKPESAWAVIEDVTLAERGRFFFDRDGVATWWNRYHLLSITTNGGTVATDTGNNKPNGLDYTYGTQLANVIRVESHPRNTGAAEVLWSLDTTITVNPGETLDFEVRLRKDTGQFAGASTLESEATFSTGDATVRVTPLGGIARVTLINESTSTPAVLTGLEITGAPVVQQNDLTVTVQDVDSIALYGQRVESIDVGPMSDYETAFNMASFELARRKDARGEVNWISYVRQADGTSDAMLLDWPIGTRLLVDAPELSHEAAYFVIGEEHVWEPGIDGGVHRGKLYLEHAELENPVWILGVVGRSEIGETTWLA